MVYQIDLLYQGLLDYIHKDLIHNIYLLEYIWLYCISHTLLHLSLNFCCNVIMQNISNQIQNCLCGTEYQAFLGGMFWMDCNQIRNVLTRWLIRLQRVVDMTPHIVLDGYSLLTYRTVWHTYVWVEFRRHSLCNVQFKFLFSDSGILEHPHFKYDVVHLNGIGEINNLYSVIIRSEQTCQKTCQNKGCKKENNNAYTCMRDLNGKSNPYWSNS